MKIGVIGHTSKIGSRLVQRGCIPLDCDILKPNTIERVLAKEKPNIVVNLASHSDPDFCEANFDKAFDVNIKGFIDLCGITENRLIPVITFSTDHIFSGKTFLDWSKYFKRIVHRGPYKEDYSRLLPVNNYGMTKLGMESVAIAYDNVKVVRTSYCFDVERMKLDIKLVRGKFPTLYPTFIERSFMHTDHFVQAFLVYLSRFFEMPKILHISGSKTISWYEFMVALAEVYGFDTETVQPRKRQDLNYAPRPHKCGLDVSLSAKLGLPQYDYMMGLKYMREKE